MATPTSIELPLKTATWAQRVAAGQQTIVRVIARDMSNDETWVVAELAPRACVALTGGWLAFVVDLGMPDEAVEAIVDLTRVTRREMGGGL